LVQFKNHLGIDPADTEKDFELNTIINGASTQVAKYCKRVFMAYSAIKTFDAPDGSRLKIPDLQSINSITAYGSLLTVETDYKKYPYYLSEELTAYSGIDRVKNALYLNWRAFAPAPGPIFREAITIDAVWGWTPTPPSDVIFVTMSVADRMWAFQNQLSASNGGSDQLGVSSPTALFPKELKQMLLDGGWVRLKPKYGTLDAQAFNPIGYDPEDQWGTALR
jgi:hypothetical protein